ncbi:hypothetical protein [Mycolicibacterium gilvum]|uniref:hypothetical protein n=1 Tax=Mycolicibacterium gilvum TaxID=1804 RepID=UPI0040462FFC
MSSREPHPDDDDTGPLNVDRVGPPTDDPRSRYDAPMSVNPRPVHRNRTPIVPIAAAAAAVVGIGALAWIFWPDAEGGQDTSADSAPVRQTESQQATDARLQGLLPEGYASGACQPVEPSKGTLAQIDCVENDDVGGPLTATYTLVENDTARKAFFDDVTARLSVVDCPGNIQSPGPWRRNAAPDQPVGTLVCGFQESRPTVAWTTDADLLISEVQSGPQGPNMVQLYTWWASHS